MHRWFERILKENHVSIERFLVLRPFESHRHLAVVATPGVSRCIGELFLCYFSLGVARRFLGTLDQDFENEKCGYTKVIHTF